MRKAKTCHKISGVCQAAFGFHFTMTNAYTFITNSTPFINLVFQQHRSKANIKLLKQGNQSQQSYNLKHPHSLMRLSYDFEKAQAGTYNLSIIKLHTKYATQRC
ncbi:hypothetical protein ISN45_At02g017310 [Arabidopsis thaliana x Arabidopsis arenosa]|uniref:Uncharacterized protein n=1 Tax=Arabidopsis thaliana x Arabidopsis arenosa TaxID=1240361 RepID=A0A8T2FLK1_9BRAS|nr:hypothetical protein ISN45_At02g017310 [Arabidopsis thaliana x Arabidopsis arenosa]